MLWVVARALLLYVVMGCCQVIIIIIIDSSYMLFCTIYSGFLFYFMFIFYENHEHDCL